MTDNTEQGTNQTADQSQKALDNQNTDVDLPDELTMLKQRARLMGITFSNNIGIDALRAKVNDKMNASTGGESQDEADEDEDDGTDDGTDGDTAGEEAEQEEIVEQDGEEIPLSPMPEPTVAVAGPSTAGSGLNPLTGVNKNKNGLKQSKEATLRQRILQDSMRLVRCRITNLDPKKKDLGGEIISVGNRYIGTVKKFIPFGEQTENGYHIPKVIFDELAGRQFLHVKTTRNKQTGQITVDTKYVKEFALEVLPQLTESELAELAAAQTAANGAANG